MKIECLGTVGIINTMVKLFLYHKKGYYIGKRYVKAKKIRKYKQIPLKEPYISGNITLKVEEAFVVGGYYIDQKGVFYVCVSVNLAQPKPISVLRNMSMTFGKTFEAPNTLTFAMSFAGEK